MPKDVKCLAIKNGLVFAESFFLVQDVQSKSTTASVLSRLYNFVLPFFSIPHFYECGINF